MGAKSDWIRPRLKESWGESEGSWEGGTGEKDKKKGGEGDTHGRGEQSRETKRKCKQKMMQKEGCVPWL